MKKIIYLIVFVFLIVFSIKRNQFFEETAFKKGKLHNYFNSVSSSLNSVNKEKREFVKDTIADIKNRSMGVEFVEISSFENAISIRCLMKNNLIKNYTYENTKIQSKHLDTVYISVKELPNLKYNCFNKLLSFIEFDFNRKEQPAKKGLLRSYVDSGGNFDMFYFSNIKNIPSYSLNKSGKYFFDDKGGSSLYLVNHLLKNYGYKKFKTLKDHNFSNFEKIYKKSLHEIRKEYELLRFSKAKKQECFNYDFFEECA